jgi:hypothetical protein
LHGLEYELIGRKGTVGLCPEVQSDLIAPDSPIELGQSPSERLISFDEIDPNFDSQGH